MVLHFAATDALPAAKHTQILHMTQHADIIWNEGKFLRSQNTGGIENTVPLHVDIPGTGGRGFDITLCSQLKVSQLFAGTCCLLKIMLGSRMAYFLTLKIQATCSFKTTVYFQQATWRYILEGRTLRNHHCENQRSSQTFLV
jgi:hypothetical protein